MNVVDNVDKAMVGCVETLKANTDRKSKSLRNVDSLDVLMAMTRLLQTSNKRYLLMYESWLVEDVKDVELTTTVLDSEKQIQ